MREHTVIVVHSGQIQLLSLSLPIISGCVYFIAIICRESGESRVRVFKFCDFSSVAFRP